MNAYTGEVIKPELISWSDKEHSLNVDRMDDTHKEFTDLINKLYIAPDEEFRYLFDKLCNHTEKHFSQENELMLQTSFPAIAEHVDEHRRILAELNQFNKRVKKGLYSFGRAYIRDTIPQWFSLHIITMDSALAAHLKNRQSAAHNQAAASTLEIT